MSPAWLFLIPAVIVVGIIITDKILERKEIKRREK